MIKNKKGIILAGGLGKRFRPITYAVNKHFLPIYKKPLFFYPLSVLMLCGIKDIQIVSDESSINIFKKILKKMKIGVNISYQVQNKPLGIADGILKSKKFINKSDFVVILGDNFYFSYYLTNQLKKIVKKKNCIVSIKKQKPNSFGVIKYKNNKIQKIIEKPNKFISNDVVTGLYVYQNKVLKICEKLKLSKRRELEITDLNNILIKKNILSCVQLGRGAVWFDAGTPEDLLKASNFVEVIETKGGFEIANLKEISKNEKK